MLECALAGRSDAIVSGDQGTRSLSLRQFPDEIAHR